MGRPFGVDLHIQGLDTMKRILGDFPKSLNAAFKRSATMTGRVVKNAAKARAPSRRKSIRIGSKSVAMYGTSGSLKKSIDNVARKPKNAQGTSTWLGIIGAKKAMGAVGWVKWYKRAKGQPTYKNTTVSIEPSRYSHLVENGSMNKLWRSGRMVQVPARPFLRPAMDSSKSQALSITTDSVNKEIEKLVKSGKASPVSNGETS